MNSCKSYSLKTALVHLLIFPFVVVGALKSEEAMFSSAVEFQGSRPLLPDEVATPDRSDVAARSNDEPVTVRGLIIEIPHAAAVRRSLLRAGWASVPPPSGNAPGTGPGQAPKPPIKIPPGPNHQRSPSRPPHRLGRQ